MGLSLWLVPSEEDGERLKVIMNLRRTSSAHRATSYPLFHPHVTLASLSYPHPSISDIFSSTPKYPGGLPIQFRSIKTGSHFFRSVYVAVTLTPALAALHEEVHKRLNLEPQAPAFPHLSLCYIDEEDALLGERNNFFRELKESGRVKDLSEEAGVGLNCVGTAPEEEAFWMSEFLATEVWLVNCSGPVESWEIKEKISIAS